MKKIDPEYAYQSRELAIQIEDTLGEPPNRKNYAKVVQSLIEEFAKNTKINDVNLLSFALVDQLRFNDIPGLLSQCDQYDSADTPGVLSMVSCTDDKASLAIITIAKSNPKLVRRAILTAFLYKHPKHWFDEDHSLESLQKSEGEEEQEDQLSSGHDIAHLFDENGDRNVG